MAELHKLAFDQPTSTREAGIVDQGLVLTIIKLCPSRQSNFDIVLDANSGWWATLLTELSSPRLGTSTKAYSMLPWCPTAVAVIRHIVQEDCLSRVFLGASDSYLDTYVMRSRAPFLDPGLPTSQMNDSHVSIERDTAGAMMDNNTLSMTLVRSMTDLEITLETTSESYPIVADLEVIHSLTPTQFSLDTSVPMNR